MAILIIVTLIILIPVLFMMHPKFGRLPSGERLERIKRSPNYRQGKFQNLSPTPELMEGASMLSIMWKFLFGKSKRSIPKQPLPSKKEDLLNLDAKENIFVWFGHSSYFMQVDGKKILVDPVFSGHASPISFTTRAFSGTDVYTADDMPEIDFLFLTHDHWDHLDYKTVLELKPKAKKIITGLGTAEHLEKWGFDMSLVEERDWNETIDLSDGFVVHTTPARHFSGRGFTRNKSLWMSFVLQTPTMKLFLGGDSGYDTFFKDIGDKYGPFDLAILECGQYNENWKYIHMLPEEVVQAGLELRAKKVIPVHWGKFALGLHDWDEPITRVTAEAKKQSMTLVTPIIGEKVNLNEDRIFPEWWKGLE